LIKSECSGSSAVCNPEVIACDKSQMREVNEEKIKEIEEKIADLKARWPPHSVPPSMWQQLEELEKELEEALKNKGGSNTTG
jgi:hypothetical protein